MKKNHVHRVSTNFIQNISDKSFISDPIKEIRSKAMTAIALLMMFALLISGCGSDSDSSSSSGGTTASTTELALSSNSVTYGANVTLTATVTPSAATGTVTFYDGTTSLGTATLSSGSASLVVNTLTVGSHTLTASYGGSVTYASSTSDSVTATVTASEATISITLSASPVSTTVGSGVALTAVVSPLTSTGTVTFYDGATSVGTAGLVSGHATATLTSTSLTSGTHTITAGYSSLTSNSVSVYVTTGASGSFSSGNCGYSGTVGSDSVTGTSAYVLSSGTLTTTGVSYSSSTANQNAVCVNGTGAHLTLVNPAISTSGNTTSTDGSSFYGIDAAVLDYNGGDITISGGTITTTGQGGNDVFSYGTGTVTISNATVTASGANGHGLYAAGGGTMVVNNVTASSTGASGSIVATDKGGGTITINGGTYSASGQRSAGIYSTGTVTANNATFSAANAEAVVVEGSNTCILTNSTLNADSNMEEHRGIFLYQSMSGDAENSTCGTGACFYMTGGTFNYTDTTNSSSTATSNCAAFAVANQVAYFQLTDVTINNDCPTLLLSALNTNWNYNGGTTTFKAYGETMTGNIIVDSVSTADIYLYASSSNPSVLTGAINNANSGSTKVALTLDSTSQWVVTGTSYLTALTDADTDYSNITKSCSSCYVYVGSTVIK